MNGYNFSERVRKVLAMAREESFRLHHEYVGTEHMLLSLLRDNDGVATATLQNLGIDRDDVAQRVAQLIEPGNSGQRTGPDLPYTSRAKKVLELAMSEARDLHHTYVGTEHLLIGLLREERGIAAQVLVEAGATTTAVRAEVLRLLGGDAATSPDTGSTRTVVRADAPAHIVSITLQLQYDSGTAIHETFPSVAEAMYFLYRIDGRNRR